MLSSTFEIDNKKNTRMSGQPQAQHSSQPLKKKVNERTPEFGSLKEARDYFTKKLKENPSITAVTRRKYNSIIRSCNEPNANVGQINQMITDQRAKRMDSRGKSKADGQDNSNPDEDEGPKQAPKPRKVREKMPNLNTLEEYRDYFMGRYNNCTTSDKSKWLTLANLTKRKNVTVDTVREYIEEERKRNAKNNADYSRRKNEKELGEGGANEDQNQKKSLPDVTTSLERHPHPRSQRYTTPLLNDEELENLGLSLDGQVPLNSDQSKAFLQVPVAQAPSMPTIQVTSGSSSLSTNIPPIRPVPTAGPLFSNTRRHTPAVTGNKVLHAPAKPSITAQRTSITSNIATRPTNSVHRVQPSHGAKSTSSDLTKESTKLQSQGNNKHHPRSDSSRGH